MSNIGVKYNAAGMALLVIAGFFFPYSFVESTYTVQFGIQLFVLISILIFSMATGRGALTLSMPFGARLIILLLITITAVNIINSIWLEVDLYSYRDIIRPITLILLIMCLSMLENTNWQPKLENWIYNICILFVLVNGILSIAWLLEMKWASTLLNLFVPIGDEVFKNGYGRYTGLYGQPNFNAIGVVFALIYIAANNGRSNLIKYMAYMLGLIAIFVSSSRTVYAGIAVLMFFYGLTALLQMIKKLAMKKTHLGVILTTMLLLPLLIYKFGGSSNLNYFFYRLSLTFDYVDNERFNIFLEIINYLKLNPEILIFGKLGDINANGYDFTDNDYLLIILKHGVIKLIFLLCALYVVCVKLMMHYNQRERKELRVNPYFIVCTLIFCAVVSMGSSVISTPQLMIMPLIVMTLIALRKRVG